MLSWTTVDEKEMMMSPAKAQGGLFTRARSNNRSVNTSANHEGYGLGVQSFVGCARAIDGMSWSVVCHAAGEFLRLFSVLKSTIVALRINVCDGTTTRAMNRIVPL